MISKEKAREILLDYFHSKYSMPIYDECITYVNGNVTEIYTFRALIKLAYNLKEDETTK